MIRKIEALKPVKRKKVAAYARVSMETERLNHSLAAQIDYYNKLIQSNPKWEYVDVFYDHGISGTSIKKRNGFQEMIAAAGEGSIDLILTNTIPKTP